MILSLSALLCTSLGVKEENKHGQLSVKWNKTFKGTVHPKKEHGHCFPLQVIPNLCNFLSSAEHKGICKINLMKVNENHKSGLFDLCTIKVVHFFFYHTHTVVLYETFCESIIILSL